MDTTKTNSEEMCNIYKAETECLRNIIEQKDKLINYLYQQIDSLSKQLNGVDD